MNKTIGIFAHVDGGKTTFTEQLLFHTGSKKVPGRVDDGTSAMDTDELEQKRGITIFADQEQFYIGEDACFIIDTPGHTDFCGETERVMEALDYGVLLINGSEGVRAHTITLFHLLERYHVPVFIFVNKMDLEGADKDAVFLDIREKLSENAVRMDCELPEEDIFTKEEAALFTAERSEEFLEAYLDGTWEPEEVKKQMASLIKRNLCYPVSYGSALKGAGIREFLSVFQALSSTDYEDKIDRPAKGLVYKIRHDAKGNKVTFLKLEEGAIKVKDEFLFCDKDQVFGEKINEIRLYHGDKYEILTKAIAGQAVGVTGLKLPVCGMRLEALARNERKKKEYYMVSALSARLKPAENIDLAKYPQALAVLEEEEPGLSVSYQKETGSLLVHVMGNIQLEVLEQIFKNRFLLPCTFEKPRVEYRETIESPVTGCGHFEPLRHYAEVILGLVPAKRGEGITFQSECHVDVLGQNYQHLIETHVFERIHRGVLTGSPITDLKVILKNGRAHIKHTEGGDFREAVYRAIRQGLEKADSILLEPFYQMDFYVEGEYAGKVMSDLTKGRGSFEPPVTEGNTVHIRGRGPVSEFMDYSVFLSSFTKGKGSVSFLFDGYDVCENQEAVVKEIGYDKERDMENTSTSVFCAKGAAFTVPWQRAEEYMHTLGG